MRVLGFVLALMAWTLAATVVAMILSLSQPSFFSAISASAMWPRTVYRTGKQLRDRAGILSV